MLRNLAHASLGNLARNRLYAAINVGGLAIALAAAILIALFVRDDLGFDRFIPGWREVWRLSITLQPPQGAPIPLAQARTDLAAALKTDFPEVRAVARLAYGEPIVRRGAVEATEKVYWADPSVFQVLRLPVYAGRLSDALARPDAVVLTRSMARKYFGRDDPIGETLELQSREGPAGPGSLPAPPQLHAMTVTAVLQDLPDDTHLDTEIIASGRAAFSALSRFDQAPRSFGPRAYTYVRLAPGADAARIVAALPAFGARHIDPRPLLGGRMTVQLTPLAAIHHLPPAPDDMKPPGSPGAVMGVALIGALIVLTAAINFVSLMSARAGQRAVEVGVRKAAGAARGQLVLQFLGEAMVLSLLALIAAVALAELAAPLLGALAGRPIRPDLAHDPALAAALVGGALALGALAGLHPALVMSGFRPAAALTGGPVAAGGGAGLRQGLAVAQFAILIALVISALVIWRQTAFALARSRQPGWDRIVLIDWPPNCLRLRDRVRTFPGVVQASCTTPMAVTGGSAPTDVTTAWGRTAPLDMAPVDFGLMELHGLRPLAGRFLSERDPRDGMLLTGEAPDKQPPVVINAAAARRLGFSSPAQAVGQTIRWQRLNPYRKGVGDDLFPPMGSQIVGVAPDFSMQSVRQPIGPMIYYVEPAMTVYGPLVVRTRGEDTAAVLAMIGRQERALGQSRPLESRSYGQIAHELYADVIRQSLAVAASAALAVVIACLGLFGLAVFTAERRIKEIGVRKAMGASSGDIVRLLLGAFTRPVLLANLIAWPAAWWAMRHWLAGFAYRVELTPWYFLAGGAAAAAAAALTVAGYAVRLALAAPAGALRCE
jgi:putative ABC transport system permease protein